jgi:hypothetical protein
MVAVWLSACGMAGCAISGLVIAPSSQWVALASMGPEGVNSRPRCASWRADRTDTRSNCASCATIELKVILVPCDPGHGVRLSGNLGGSGSLLLFQALWQYCHQLRPPM